jgi:hypothetical protein
VCILLLIWHACILLLIWHACILLLICLLQYRSILCSQLVIANRQGNRTKH